MIEAKSSHQIPDDEWLLDHVYPNVNGHQLIADALTDVIVRKQHLQYPAHWRDQQRQRWQAHLMSLAEGYYENGFEHLMMLKARSRRRGEVEKKTD